MSLCFTAALFTTQLISICVAAPVTSTNGPWMNPCGGESDSGLSLNHPSSSSPSITEGLLSLERISRAAMDQIDSLIMAIIDDVVRKDIQLLSKIGVFLEGARLDTSAYSDKIRTIEQKNVEMLCKLHTILPGRSVTADVSRDIMPTIFRNLIDSTQIDGRNYIIMRDVKKIFAEIEENFEAYKEENNL